jgi:hypothetical protein
LPDWLGARAAALRVAAVVAVCIGCAVVIASGVVLLLQYENAPGDAGDTPSQWPEGSVLALDATRPTLVVCAHPRCPCTRATIGELERLMARLQGKIVSHVLFFTPSDAPLQWVRTDLWNSAERIPGVAVHSDPGGIDARKFGAVTSGHTVLYSRGGDLMFHGGITGSRGHAGDNAGSLAIESLLRDGVSDQTQTYVYGCPLLDQHPQGGD